MDAAGTLHLHPADELGLWTAARRAVVGERDYEVDGLEDVVAVVEAIGEALRGATLNREELADAVVARVGPAPREKLASGWGYYLGDAAVAGVLCFGPPQGQKVTFVHPDDWLGPQQAWEPEEALREVARRYAATYGPVTSGDFREWFTSRSFTPERARALFDELDLPTSEEATAVASVRLLPEYDAYVMAVRDRERLVRRRCASRSPRTARAATKGLRASRSCSSTVSAPGSGPASGRRSGSMSRSSRRGG